MTESFSLEILVVAVSSLTAIAVTVIKAFTDKDRRAKLLSDLDILEKLDKDSDAHTQLKHSVERRVVGMADTGEKTRDTFSITLGVLFLIIGITLLPVFNSLGGWWLLLHMITAFIVLFGIVGIATGWKKVPRDEKGNAIKAEK